LFSADSSSSYCSGALHGPERGQNQALAFGRVGLKARLLCFAKYFTLTEDNMGIYNSFAVNLRRHCLEFQSIAEVCRGIDINRQQFNKYLAGQMLPNSRTLQRICSFLKVSEEELFQNTADLVAAPVTNNFGNNTVASHELHRFIAALEPKLKIDDEVIRPGYYFCYFPLQNFGSLLLRSLIVVTKQDGMAKFSRLTIVPARGKRGSLLARGRHTGIVFASAREIYLLGVQKEFQSQCSIISIDRAYNLKSSIYQGMALTRGANAQMASRVAIEYLGPKTNIRMAIKSLGPVEISSPGLNRHIVAILAPRPTQLDNQVSAINEDRLFSESLPM
jgi:transcriptional regulator with XRE-family HTH domain